MKELLIRLRDQIKDKTWLASGLCLEITESSNFNDDEKIFLISYIIFHRPTEGKHFNKDYFHSPWYWPSGDVEPRLDWLEDEIKKH